jgi:phosphatidylserine/phosphatidylglycerophosphate/cardiolipin synthase-like enzyme
VIPDVVAAHVIHLARTRPTETVLRLAQTIAAAEGQAWRQARTAILDALPQAALRADAAALLDAWQAACPSGSQQALAWALVAAAQGVAAERSAQSVALVWTGPQVDGPALRRTDQALQEVIAAARQELLLISFAIYMTPHIEQALVDAAGRGVRIRIALETPSASAGRIDYDTVRSLGAAVSRSAELYTWPEAQRQRDAQGNLGALHAKCAVADRQLLFVSSANLTGYALTINVELGVLIRGGALPGDVVTQVDRLIEGGVLQRMQG